jgi:fibro-slime domain-containing protein
MPSYSGSPFCVALIASAGLAACSSSSRSGNGAAHTGAPEAGIIFIRPLGDGSVPHGDPPPNTLPPGFTKTDKGGMKLGDPLADGTNPGAGGNADGGAGGGCGTKLLAVVRDFHPDGKNFEGKIADDRGLVANQLGMDEKPVFVKPDPTATTSGSAAADQFYRSVPGTNTAYLLELWFEPNGGVLTFHSNAFFPLDGKGFGNEGNAHDFHFTTELHTAFEYKGGETFQFLGDDDLWVFINGKLAIDLGGVHGAEPGSVDLDAKARDLGIKPGSVYPLDLFHAERHTTQSNFRVDTNLAFVDCGKVVPDVR